ncbi:MAG: NusG domain II-containing protein [Oscillospiraceae bacterium]|nr:NusG domain II-containing protein [Oscillospiraceae bacterium]
MKDWSKAVKRRKNDLILIFAALLLAAALWGALAVFRSEGAYALVTVNGEEYGRYALDKDTQQSIISGEHSNLLAISEGGARISEADCPDKLCVNQGEIRYSGQSIICLPHKVVVEIVGGERSNIDAVVR